MLLSCIKLSNTLTSNSLLIIFALYKAIVPLCDNEPLQDDLTKIYGWCKKWLLMLNPLKCESICLSYKHLPLFSRWSTDSSKISIVRYLGVFINSKLKWGDYVKHLAAKASCLLNYLCHTLFSCSSSVKATAYKTAYKATNFRVCFPGLIPT